MSYHGWKNWETWNVALWLGNDEGAYRECLRLAKRANHYRPIESDHAELIVRELMPDGTPGMDQTDKGYAAVDWNEIAADINEMAGLEEEPA